MNAIVAANADWGIGLGGSQSIVIPGDRRRFRILTDGGIVISGRKTFESLPAPLHNRRKIVLTRDRTFTARGVVVAHSIDDVFAEIADDDPNRVFVIGGGGIYGLLLPFCSHAYVTRINAAPPSDVFFPDLDSLPDWSLEQREFRIWNPAPGIDEAMVSALEYSFDLYKNNTMEDIYV